jgi:hypothetical protein
MLTNIRPITNIRHKAVNIAKKSNLYEERNVFLGGSCRYQLIYGQQKHTVHACTKNGQCQRKVKFLTNGKLINKTFFVFGSTCQIFVSAKYSSENIFGRSLPRIEPGPPAWQVASQDAQPSTTTYA